MEKKFQLLLSDGRHTTYIMEGTIALLKWKKKKIERYYRTGKLIICSMDGYKYSIKPKMLRGQNSDGAVL